MNARIPNVNRIAAILSMPDSIKIPQINEELKANACPTIKVTEMNVEMLILSF